MNVSLEIAALFHSAMVGTFILNLLYREHPKNIRCLTKRYVAIEHAGVQLIINKQARRGVASYYLTPRLVNLDYRAG